MLIPSKRADLIRKYEGVVFHEGGEESEKLNGFYLLIRPLLEWLRHDLRALGLERDEIESELYLLSCKIFKGYDRTKSSIIPYLAKYIQQYATNFIRSARTQYKPIQPIDYSGTQWNYSIDEEFYWKVPGIMLEDKYVGRYLTRAEKYVVYKMLTLDEDQLTISGIAKACGVSRTVIRKILSDLRVQFNWRLTNE